GAKKRAATLAAASWRSNQEHPSIWFVRLPLSSLARRHECWQVRLEKQLASPASRMAALSRNRDRPRKYQFSRLQQLGVCPREPTSENCSGCANTRTLHPQTLRSLSLFPPEPKNKQPNGT